MNAVRCATVAMILAVGISCTDTPRTNPFDPQAHVELVLVGPDSATSVGDTVAFDVRTANGESLVGVANWSLPPFLQQTGHVGWFIVVAGPTAARSNGTVTAFVNANQVSKEFILSQQPTSLRVWSCEDGEKVLSFTALLNPAAPTRGVQYVCMQQLDRRGNPVPAGTTLPSVIVRDPTVARFVDANERQLNATAVGSTYVVFSNGGGRGDSLLVTARQDVANVTIDPAPCMNQFGFGLQLRPNDTVQLTAKAPVTDANGNPFTDPAFLQSVLASIWWAPYTLDASVTPSGLVTVNSGSNGAILAQLGGPLGPIVGACPITVN